MSALERNAGREMLDAAPLQAVIRRDLEKVKRLSPADCAPSQNGASLLAARIGIDERRIWSILHQPRVTLDLADRYCTAAGHVLALVYPEAYSDDSIDGFPWRCKHCNEDVDMKILSETPKRMILECRDCGRRHYAERRKRGAPVNGFPRAQVDDAAIVAAYQAGGTLLGVARRFGFRCDDAVRMRLREAGIKPRERWSGNSITVGKQNLQKGIVYQLERGERTRRIVAELWPQGVPIKEIAERAGVSVQQVSAQRKHMGLPTRRRTAS